MELIPYGWVPCFSLDAGGRNLFLPQLAMPGFVDAPWEALPFPRSGWRDGGRGRKEVRGRKGRRGGRRNWYVK